MIKIYPYKDLGHHDMGWLDARYHFSFAEYHNRDRMGFGALRVINDDVIKAGAGFDMHPHRDMEIITYIRQGAITHKDSFGNEGRTVAGDVQVMSAGTGIYHSEFNLESEDTKLFQIWIHPQEKDIKPRWDTREFPKQATQDVLPLLVSGRKADAEQDVLYIHQDAAIYGGRLNKGTELTHIIHQQAYLLVSEGELRVNGQALSTGDGAEISDIDTISIQAVTDAELVIIDVPQQIR